MPLPLFNFGRNKAPASSGDVNPELLTAVNGIIAGPGSVDDKLAALEAAAENVSTDADVQFFTKSLLGAAQGFIAKGGAPDTEADPETDLETDPEADPEADPEGDEAPAPVAPAPQGAALAAGPDPEAGPDADPDADPLVKGMIDGTEAVMQMIDGLALIAQQNQELAGEYHRQAGMLTKALPLLEALGGVAGLSEMVESRLNAMDEKIEKSLNGNKEMLSKSLGDIEENARFIKALRHTPAGQPVNGGARSLTEAAANGYIVKADLAGANPLGGALSSETAASGPTERFGIRPLTLKKGLAGTSADVLRKAGISDEQYFAIQNDATPFEAVPRPVFEIAAQTLGLTLSE